jgi:hypothetical protein
VHEVFRDHRFAEALGADEDDILGVREEARTMCDNQIAAGVPTARQYSLSMNRVAADHASVYERNDSAGFGNPGRHRPVCRLFVASVNLL